LRAALLIALAGCVSAETTARFRAAHARFGERATAFAPVTLIGTTLPDGRIHKEPGTVGFDQATLDAVVPVPQTKDSFLVVGALAGVKHLDFDGVPVLADDTLHRYGVRLGYGAFVDDDLFVQAYWQPSVYSDLDGTLRSEDWRLTYGTALAVWRVNDDLFWKLGVIATDAVDTGALPLVGVTWHFAPQWSLQTLLPRNLDVVWSSGDGWNVYAGFLVESDEYHVRSAVALGLEDDVHVQEVLAHLTVERAIGGGAAVLLRGGTTVAGNWDYGYGNGTDDLTGTLEADPFVAAGVTWRF